MIDFSSLFNENTFYKSFLNDLKKCNEEVIIESPFITSERVRTFTPIFEELLKRNVKIYVITRDPKEHNEYMEIQSEEEISMFEIIGVQTLLCSGNHHRKLAIIDRKILWEGSLNILSQNNSREIMRRIEDEDMAIQMFNFLEFGKYF